MRNAPSTTVPLASRVPIDLSRRENVAHFVFRCRWSNGGRIDPQPEQVAALVRVGPVFVSPAGMHDRAVVQHQAVAGGQGQANLELG